MAKRKAELISKDELTDAIAMCEASPAIATTNCRVEGCEGKVTGEEALPTGSHVAIVEASVSVHNRPALEPPVTLAENEEVSELEEALEAFWSLLLDAGYEPC